MFSFFTTRKQEKKPIFTKITNEEDNTKNPFHSELYKTHFQRIFHDEDQLAFDHNDLLKLDNHNAVEKSYTKQEEPSSCKDSKSAEVKSNILADQAKKKLKKQKRPKKDQDDRFSNGRWQPDEHKRFIEAILKYGNDWRKVENYVGTRTSTQARSHAQKFFEKMKIANLVDIDLDLEKKTAIKSLHIALKSMEKDKNTDMLGLLNKLAFDRKSFTTKSSCVSLISDEDQKTNDISSEKKKSNSTNTVNNNNAKKQVGRPRLNFVKHKDKDNQNQTNQDNLDQKNLKGKSSIFTVNSESQTQVKVQAMNSNIDQGLIKINNQISAQFMLGSTSNLRRKRSRFFSGASNEFNFHERDHVEKEDFQKIMMHLFNNKKDLEACDELKIVDEYEDIMYYDANKSSVRSIDTPEQSNRIRCESEDVIKKFLAGSEI